jgi:membrane-bound lytic murein transglycosylase B
MIARYVLCLFFLVCPLSVSFAGTVTFAQWLDSFYPKAARQGISRATWQAAFAGVTEADTEVLRKAAYQPEFTTRIWDYLDARINRRSIATGLVMAGVHRKTLQEIERRFGVEKEIVLAIWSMETSYGQALLRTSRLHAVPRALATLAWKDTKRKKFAEKQLIAALKILQKGDVDPHNFTGSWAGAMGHTQFIPTSYLAYGVDMDNDGRRDIWHSVPDALATAANLLKKNGWRNGKPWGFEVQLPAEAETWKGQTKTIRQWQKLGIHRPGGEPFTHTDQRAELKIFAGASAPAFLVLRNFFVIKRYNNSDFYALTVGLLADRLHGRKGVQQEWPRPAGALKAEEKFVLQELLKKKGLYAGEIDGHLGPATASAIRKFQQQVGLNEDGKATRQILEALRK